MIVASLTAEEMNRNRQNHRLLLEQYQSMFELCINLSPRYKKDIDDFSLSMKVMGFLV